MQDTNPLSVVGFAIWNEGGIRVTHVAQRIATLTRHYWDELSKWGRMAGLSQNKWRDVRSKMPVLDPLFW